MFGLALPKLRWLVIGAVASGVWAMTQNPAPQAGRHAPVAPSRSVSQPAARAAAPVERAAERAAAAGAIHHPQQRLERTVFTRERVRLRADPSTNAAVMTWLESGQRLSAQARSGDWLRVATGGRQGWVHREYLASADPAVRRPAAGLPVKQQTAAPSAPLPTLRETARPLPPTPVQGSAPTAARLTVADRLPPGTLSRRPARAPQKGDCQCPYDLMISGKQCGERSALRMRGRTDSLCYL
jgi:hypothetical protein